MGLAGTIEEATRHRPATPKISWVARPAAYRTSAGVEVGAELTVEDDERVADEPLGGPLLVVVGRDEPGGVLEEVGAEEQPLTRLERVGEGPEEGPAFLDVEVADGAAEEGDQPPTVAGQVAQVEGEVADHGLDLHAAVPRGELDGRRAQGLVRDVDGDESAQGPGPATGVAEGVEEDARLLARAAAELDEGRGVAGGGDRRGVLEEDRPLGPGRVVLGQPRDGVEQP